MIVESAKRWLPWLVLLVTVVAIEWFVRFAIPFRLERVLIVEASLFTAAAIATLVLMRRPPLAVGWVRVGQWVLAASLVLASVRAALWASGVRVFTANLVILGLAALTVVTIRLLRRTRG